MRYPNDCSDECVCAFAASLPLSPFVVRHSVLLRDILDLGIILRKRKGSTSESRSAVQQQGEKRDGLVIEFLAEVFLVPEFLVLSNSLKLWKRIPIDVHVLLCVRILFSCAI